MKYVIDKADKIRKERPDLPNEFLPKPIFVARILPIRKEKGQEPIFRNVLWQSTGNCGDIDVHYLTEFLCSQGRDCHINNGVHGKIDANEKFDFVWDKASDIFNRQDYEHAIETKNNVSLHAIT